MNHGRNESHILCFLRGKLDHISSIYSIGNKIPQVYSNFDPQRPQNCQETKYQNWGQNTQIKIGFMAR